MSIKSRGRPKKDPEERRSKPDQVRVEPSRKEILRKESERRGAPMAELFRKTAFEEIEPHDRHIPQPDVLAWLLGIAEEVSQKADRLEAKWLLEDLRDLETEIRLKRVEIQQQRTQREQRRTAAEDETMEGHISFTLTKEEDEWLKDMAEKKEVPLRRMLREAAFKQIRKQEEMRKIEQRLKAWEGTISQIREEEEVRGSDAPDDEDRVRGAMKDMGVRISRFVKEETNWE